MQQGGALECLRAWRRDDEHISAMNDRCILAPQQTPPMSDSPRGNALAYGTDWGCDYDWEADDNDGERIMDVDSAICECTPRGTCVL